MLSEDTKDSTQKEQVPPMDFEVIFLPFDDGGEFEERFRQGRALAEDGKCVLLIPFRKSESGHPMM